MLFLVIVIVVDSFLLAGCTSANSVLRGIYVISLSYNTTRDEGAPRTTQELLNATTLSSAQLDVRVGYFGVCAKANRDWICQHSFGSFEMSKLFPGDPLSILALGLRYKNDVLFPELLIASIGLAVFSFILFATFPSWHYEEDEFTGEQVDVKPFPSRAVVKFLLFSTMIASIFSLVSVLWQHTSAVTAVVMLEGSNSGFIRGSTGPAGIALAWLTFFFLVVVFLGTVVMKSSMLGLDMLTGD